MRKKIDDLTLAGIVFVGTLLFAGAIHALFVLSKILGTW